MGKLNRRKPPKVLCACNKCGLEVSPGKKFIQGHNGVLNTWMAGRKPWNFGLTKETDERVKLISLNLTGKTLSKEAIEKVKIYQNLPETKKANSERQTGKKQSMETIELIRIKCRNLSIALWESNEFREKMLISLNSKETTEKMSISGKIKWEDPEYRKMQTESHEKYWDSLCVEQKNELRIKSSFYIDGRSYKSQEYPDSWNERLKNQVRDRDNRACQLCYIHESLCKRQLHVHHIDYNKENCDLDNLISLCNSCHTKTNSNPFDRYYWEIMLSHIVLYGVNPNLYLALDDEKDPCLTVNEKDINRSYGFSRMLKSYCQEERMQAN